jgi:hypothetical protein
VALVLAFPPSLATHYSKKSLSIRQSFSTHWASAANCASDMSGWRKSMKMTSLPRPLGTTRMGLCIFTPDSNMTSWSKMPKGFFPQI